MNPQLLALFTAMAWGIGGYFEKRACTWAASRRKLASPFARQ